MTSFCTTGIFALQGLENPSPKSTTYDTLETGNVTDPEVIDCKTDCYDDQFECTYGCPCYRNCLQGCPCDSYSGCPTTTVPITTTIKTSTTTIASDATCSARNGLQNKDSVICYPYHCYSYECDYPGGGSMTPIHVPIPSPTKPTSGTIDHTTYRNFDCCKWFIYSSCAIIRVESEIFDTEEYYDYVYVDGREYHGRHGTVSVNQEVYSNTFEVVFKADHRYTYQGFKLNWYCI